MPESASPPLLKAFDSFGSALKYLRRRAHLSQRNLSIAVGYSESQISRFESGHQLPDVATLVARFVPALEIQDEPEIVTRLLELAQTAHAAAESLSTVPTTTRPRYNLPFQLTSFIGREKEISELKRLLTPFCRTEGTERSWGEVGESNVKARLIDAPSNSNRCCPARGVPQWGLPRRAGTCDGPGFRSSNARGCAGSA
jgi:hypothetical protein